MRWPLRILASLLVAAGLLTLLMVWGEVSPVEVLAILRELPLEVFLGALGLHLFTYVLRALRFRILIPLERRPSMRRAFVISLAHNMASYVLPAKTGDASLVVYLKVHGDVAPSSGLAALLVARFLDGATLCLCLALTCSWMEATGRHPGLEWLGSVSGLLAVLALVFLVLSVRGDLMVRGVETPLRLLRLHRLRLGERILERTNSLALALRSAGSGGRLLGAALFSVPIWISVFGFFTMLARSMGIPEWVTFPEVTLSASIGMVFNLLPVNAAGGIGTQELGWVTGFHQFLGVDYDVALRASMGVHLIQLFNVVALGLVGHLAMGVMPRVGSE